jgi:single-strand DNA-binding protein
MSVESTSVESTVARTVTPDLPDIVNSVILAGTIVVAGEVKPLAGDIEAVQWTVKVPRGPGRSGNDQFDCLALEPVLQQRALAWEVGTPMTVEGALRRRFFRTGGRTVTRIEVEVDQVTLLELT